MFLTIAGGHSDEEDRSEDFLSDSQTSSDSDTDSDDMETHQTAAYHNNVGRRLMEKGNCRGRTLAKNGVTSR